MLVSGAEHAGAVAALRDDVTVPHYVAVGDAERARSYEELLAGAPGDRLDEPVQLDQTCMIQYSSGTTGHPKDVMLSHANITWIVSTRCWTTTSPARRSAWWQRRCSTPPR